VASSRGRDRLMAARRRASNSPVANGFGHKIVGSGIECGNLLRLGIPHGPNDDWDFAPSSQALEDIQPADVRQAEIEKHNVGARVHNRLESEGSIFRILDLISSASRAILKSLRIWISSSITRAFIPESSSCRR